MKIIFRIIKPLIMFLCLFVFDKDKRGKMRRYAKFCEFEYAVRHGAKSVGEGLRVEGRAKVSSETVLGNNVRLNDGFCVTGGGSLVMGDNISTGVDILILTQNHDYDDGETLPFGKNYAYKEVRIDDNVWIGSRVTILPGAHIEEGAIIQAGAVVHGVIPKCSIAGGNPAKVFKQRNIEHYEKLKAEKKFF